MNSTSTIQPFPLFEGDEELMKLNGVLQTLPSPYIL